MEWPDQGFYLLQGHAAELTCRTSDDMSDVIARVSAMSDTGNACRELLGQAPGFPAIGASEADIAEQEERLGIRLPACFAAAWLPGVERHRSFFDLVASDMDRFKDSQPDTS